MITPTFANYVRILLANLSSRDTAVRATLVSACLWPFKNGTCAAPFLVLRGSPTVTHEPGLSTAYENSEAIFSRVSVRLLFTLFERFW
jgi:hypothetical protein